MTSRSKFSNSTVRVDKYLLGRTLGEGNFAKMKFERNIETGENVANKILDKEKLLKHKMIGQLKIQGEKSGRKGHLSIMTEVFEAAPSLCMVEISKAGGDTLEFLKFYKNLSTGLKDVVWKVDPFFVTESGCY